MKEPLWFVLLVIVGLIIGAYIDYRAIRYSEDVVEGIPVLIIGTFIFGFSLLGAIGIILSYLGY